MDLNHFSVRQMLATTSPALMNGGSRQSSPALQDILHEGSMQYPKQVGSMSPAAMLLRLTYLAHAMQTRRDFVMYNWEVRLLVILTAYLIKQ